MTWVIITDKSLMVQIVQHLHKPDDRHPLPIWIIPDTINRRDKIIFCEMYNDCLKVVRDPAKGPEERSLLPPSGTRFPAHGEIKMLCARAHSYSQNIVDNLRSEHGEEIKPFTDDQIYNGWSNWSASDDYENPNELKSHIIATADVPPVIPAIVRERHQHNNNMRVALVVNRRTTFNGTLVNNDSKTLLLEKIEQVDHLFMEQTPVEVTLTSQARDSFITLTQYDDNHDNHILIRWNDGDYYYTIEASLHTISGRVAFVEALKSIKF